MYDISALNDAWAITGNVSFKVGKGQMPIVEISNDWAQASLALQGAHILNFRPKGEAELIWMSEDAVFAAGKSPRGGIPICWPWFGAHVMDKKMPTHGLARTLQWQPIGTELLPDGRISVRLEMQQNKQTRSVLGHALQVQVHIVVGRSLEVTLETKNLGSTSFVLGQALHTYFQVSDVRHVSVEGLGDCEYLDKLEGFARKKQYGAVTIRHEIDRVYVNTGRHIRIIDKGLQREVVIRNMGSASTIVWNPWLETAEKMGDLGQEGYLRMLCVETANAWDDVIQLAAGASHVMSVAYHVERIAS